MKTKTTTIARTIILFLVIVNIVLNILGITPIEFDENQIYELVTVVTAVVVPIWAWWKNNSFTIEAKKADEILELLRTEGIPAIDELLQIICIGIKNVDKESNDVKEMQDSV